MIAPIENEDDRNLILIDGGLMFDPDRKLGRILQDDVAKFGLKANDRLDPNSDLRNVGKFETAPLPMRVTFWRTHVDASRRLADPVLRRNPLFCRALHITPQSVMMIDLLHCVYLGVMIVYVSAVMWATLDDNIWGVRGSRTSIIDIGVQYILNNIKEWGQANPNIDQSRLIHNLTPGMLGSDAKRT